LANFAHLDNQSDSENRKKKAKQRHSKALGEKRPNPGSFCFTAIGGSFFQRHKQELQSGQFGLRMAKKWRTSSPYFVSSFAKLFCYSSGYTVPEINTPPTSKRHPNNTCWRLACVADLVRASSLDAAKTSPKNACWCRALAGFKGAFPCTTHTPVSFRSPAQHTKQGKHAKAKAKQK
jgi:hypothetical protein